MREEDLDQVFKDPVLQVLSLVVVGFLLMQDPSPKPSVPGLGGRRNAAWRGKGSFGKAPFGSQIGHRR